MNPEAGSEGMGSLVDLREMCCDLGTWDPRSFEFARGVAQSMFQQLTESEELTPTPPRGSPGHRERFWCSARSSLRTTGVQKAVSSGNGSRKRHSLLQSPLGERPSEWWHGMARIARYWP